MALLDGGGGPDGGGILTEAACPSGLCTTRASHMLVEGLLTGGPLSKAMPACMSNVSYFAYLEKLMLLVLTIVTQAKQNEVLQNGTCGRMRSCRVAQEPVVQIAKGLASAGGNQRGLWSPGRLR